MKVRPTSLPGVLIVEPVVRRDDRGYFMEAYSEARYAAHGIGPRFVQDNIARSRRGVARGLHFQHPFGQGKLVGVARGDVFDVAVDVRRGSPTFGRWHGELLTSGDHRQLWIPPGFAHGYLTLSEEAIFVYKCTEYFRPDAERTLKWNDPAIGIDWPLQDVLLSPRDADALPLAELQAEHLPDFLPP